MPEGGCSTFLDRCTDACPAVNPEEFSQRAISLDGGVYHGRFMPAVEHEVGSSPAILAMNQLSRGRLDAHRPADVFRVYLP